MREFLVHVNVQTTDDDDTRTVEEISEAISGAIFVGSDDESLAGLNIEIAMAEEV